MASSLYCTYSHRGPRCILRIPLLRHPHRLTHDHVLRKVADCSLLSVSHSNHLARLGPFEIYHLTPSPPILVRQKVDRSSSHFYHIVLSGPAFKSKIDEVLQLTNFILFQNLCTLKYLKVTFLVSLPIIWRAPFQADFLILKKL